MIKATEVVLVSTSDIKPWDKNKNKHSKEQIDRLVELISYQGFRNPLVISRQSGNLIAGHGRLEAALQMGMKEVPVIYQDFDNSDQEYAFMVSDNAIQSWAELDLAGINMDVQDLGPDFNIDMLGIAGFTIDPSEVDLPDLESKDPDFQQITFVLSNEQKDILDQAMEKAKKEEDCSDEINQNKNGNVLIAALKRYVYG